MIKTARYYVVVVDLMMPRVDGAAFVVELREREKSSIERPVVLLMTALSAREKLEPIGGVVQALIPKPFDVIEVAELIRDCAEVRRKYDVVMEPVTDPGHGATRPIVHNEN